MSTVTEEMSVATKGGRCFFGAKIVRGAYMDKERALAAKHGYPDPVNPTYEATGRVYDGVIQHLLESNPEGYLVIATHNEAAVRTAAGRIPEGVRVSGKVVFGQIYGMAEQISVPLGISRPTDFSSGLL